MKRSLLIILAVFVLLGQTGSLEHAYHDHETGESCDYCVHSKSLDHTVTASILSTVQPSALHWHAELPLPISHKTQVASYAVRAPPRSI